MNELNEFFGSFKGVCDKCNSMICSCSIINPIEQWVNKIHNGDALELANQLPDESIDMIITSPPYFQLRNYLPKGHHNKEKEIGNEDDPYEYIGKLIKIFNVLKRKIKKSGTLFCNLGDVYFGGGPQSFERENRNIKWYEESIKNPHRRDKSKYEWMKPKQLMLIPSRFAIEMQNSGWILRNDLIWKKENAMPTCLHPDTKVYIKENNKISIKSLKQLVNKCINNKLILSPRGWKKINNIWKKQLNKRINFEVGKIGKISCSEEHRFPISHDNRRRNYEFKKAIDIKDSKITDKILVKSISEFIDTNLYNYTFEDGRFIGLYTAEGGFSHQKYPKCKFTVHINEIEIQEFILEYCRKFVKIPLKWVSNNEHNYSYIQIYSNRLKEFITQFVNGKCKSKFINIDYILNCNKEFRQGIFKGIVDGDGYISKDGRIMFAFASEELRNNLQILCSSLGLYPSVINKNNFDKRTNKIYNSFVLYIPPSYQTQFLKSQKKSIPLVEKGRFGSKGWKAEFRNDILCNTFRIRNKNIENGNFEFIDLEVEDNLFLLSNGIISHNSVQDRWKPSYEHIFFFVKYRRYFFDLNSIREPHKTSLKSLQNRIDYDTERSGGKLQEGKLGTGQWSTNKRQINPLGRVPADSWKYNEHKTPDDVFTKNPKGMSRLNTLPAQDKMHPLGSTPSDTFSKYNVTDDFFSINTEPHSFAHFAVYPIKLLEAPIKAGSPKEICSKCGTPKFPITTRHQGDSTMNDKYTEEYKVEYTKCNCKSNSFIGSVILDPFIGSGTTAIASEMFGRRWIGFELNPEYIKIAEKRLAEYKKQKEFFDIEDYKNLKTLQKDAIKTKPLMEFFQ